MFWIYRPPPAGTIPIEKPQDKLKAVVCFFLGHDWKELATSSKHVALCHLHHMAGTLADCQRCHKRWDDLPAGWETIAPKWKEQ